MSTGRLLAASLAGGVTLFIVGFVLWGLVLAGFYEAHVGTATGVTKEEMDFITLFLSQFLWAFLMALVIGKWAALSGFGQGLKIGAVMGFLMSLSIGLSQYSMSNLHDLTLALTDPFVSAVWSGLGGGVVGAVLGGGREDVAA
jgi:hypothetical protein